MPAPTHLPAMGWLRDISIPRILLACSESRFQGHLSLERGSHRVKLHIEAGALFLVECDTDDHDLLAELVRAGALSPVQLEHVQARARSQPCSETVALLAMKCVPATEILKALKSNSRQRALDCFAWPDGHYRLSCEKPQAGRSDTSRIELLKLVQEGLSRQWSFERLIEPFWPNIERCPKPTGRFGALIELLNKDLTPADRVPAIDGTQVFTAAFQDLLRSRRGASNLWILNELGALAYTSSGPRTESAPNGLSPDIEIQVSQDTTSTGRTLPKPSTDPALPSRPSAESLRKQIEKWAQALDDVDHFTLLDITPDASRGDIKKAYLAAAKTYHPDRLAALGLEDLRPTASEVFARMGEAFETLSDPSARSDYEAMQRGEYSRQDAQQAAQAETLYRKAEVLIKMGDFDKAIDFLRPAVELWGEEPEYQNALGWALFKKREPEFSAAVDHLSLALKLHPSDAQIQKRLHTVRLASPKAPEPHSGDRGTSAQEQFTPRFGKNP